MVPSDDSPTINTNKSPTNVADSVAAISKIPNDIRDETSIKTDSIINERILAGFEEHLIVLRKKAIMDHHKRMIIVHKLVRSCGMDNQQQDSFVREIDKLFRPFPV
jgi:hypothetical protein